MKARGVGNEQFWRTRFPDFCLFSPWFPSKMTSYVVNVGGAGGLGWWNLLWFLMISTWFLLISPRGVLDFFRCRPLVKAHGCCTSPIRETEPEVWSGPSFVRLWCRHHAKSACIVNRPRSATSFKGDSARWELWPWWGYPVEKLRHSQYRPTIKRERIGWNSVETSAQWPYDM